MIICDALIRMTALLLQVGARRQCLYAFLQQKVEVGEDALLSFEAF